VDAAPDPRYREGPGFLLGSRFLLFAISLGLLFLAANATQPARLPGAAVYILSFFAALIGLGIPLDGIGLMTRRQPRSEIP